MQGVSSSRLVYAHGLSSEPGSLVYGDPLQLGVLLPVLLQNEQQLLPKSKPAQYSASCKCWNKYGKHIIGCRTGKMTEVCLRRIWNDMSHHSKTIRFSISRGKYGSPGDRGRGRAHLCATEGNDRHEDTAATCNDLANLASQPCLPRKPLLMP